ncbi:MAG TPA: hypothetical protein VKP67_27735 [Xanthobacteraceae bacterium]|nr:hypothetical protein [Xanthobacteraceae bacterium]
MQQLEPIKPETVDPDALLSTRQVCAMFGNVTTMTLHRWRFHPTPGAPKFPDPDCRIGSVNYWTRATIIAYRDEQIARQKAKRKARDHANSADCASSAPSAPSPSAGATQGNTSRGLGG